MAPKEEKMEAEMLPEIIWHVKAVHPEGKLLDVKAIDVAGTIYDVQAIQDADQQAIHPEGRTLDVKALDGQGNIYDIKAIQDSDQGQLMDIRALVDADRLPVKILVGNDRNAPIKAITKREPSLTLRL
jgi:hypothetical protein